MPSGLVDAKGRKITRAEAVIHKGRVSLIPKRLEVSMGGAVDGETYIGVAMKLKKPAALLFTNPDRVVVLEIDGAPVADAQVGLTITQAADLADQLQQLLAQLTKEENDANRTEGREAGASVDAGPDRDAS